MTGRLAYVILPETLLHVGRMQQPRAPAGVPLMLQTGMVRDCLRA